MCVCVYKHVYIFLRKHKLPTAACQPTGKFVLLRTYFLSEIELPGSAPAPGSSGSVTSATQRVSRPNPTLSG